MRARDGLTRLLAGLAAAALLTIAAAGPSARADSIWDKRTRAHGFLYSDNLAADVGDSITVVINDKTTFKKDDERELERTTESSGTVKVETSLVDLGIPSGTLTESSSRTVEGSDEFDATWEFVDSITATVVDKLPNGNLVVAGRSERHIRGEDVTTILTGIVKPEDVSAGNSVLSSRVARLRLHYETAGTSSAYVTGGWLTRALDLVWPF
jgi:flagellar L-ring protein precursor FlgH